MNKTKLDRDNDTPERIAFSRVIKPHGLRGEVILAPYRGAEGSLENLETVWNISNGCERKLTVASARKHKGRYIIKITGIDKIEDAEPLVGSELFADISILDKEALQLLVLSVSKDIEVFDAEGNRLGVLEGMIETGAHPVVSVRMENGKELLVPYVEQFVKDVNIAEKRLVLSPPEGIFEINDF